MNKARALGWKYYGDRWIVASKEENVLSGNGYKSIADDTDYQDFIFEEDFSLADQNYCNAGLIFRVTGPSTGIDSYKGYYVGFNKDTLYFGKVNNNWTQIDIASISVSANTMYHIKVEAVGYSFKNCFNNSVSPDIQATDSTWDSGAIGLRTYYIDASFDNIYVIPK